jgi:hypothetical protein
MFIAHWKLRLATVVATVAAGAIAAEAAAQAPQTRFELVHPPTVDREVVYVADSPNDALPTSDYWIGIHMATPWLPELAKAQLGLEHGLMVERAMPDSPAAKAGIEKHDILLQAGDTPLKEPADLIKAVDAAKESTLSLTFLRGGKERTIDVTPRKRQAPQTTVETTERAADHWRATAARPELRVEIKRLEEALNQLKAKAGEAGAEIVIARPAIVTAPYTATRVLTQAEYPKDLTVRILKEGDQPVKVYVKRGHIEQEVPEDRLDELPAEVRGHVLRLLGRPAAPLHLRSSSSGVPAAQYGLIRSDGKAEAVELYLSPYVAPAAPAAPTRPTAPRPPVAAVPPTQDAKKLDLILKRLDEMHSRSVQQLQQEIQQLRKELDQLRATRE